MARILIVEDEPPLLQNLVRQFRKSGHQVIGIDDGQRAVTAVVRSQPDLILLDIILPNKNGFEILKELKQTHQITTPIIIISNLGEEADLETGHQLGADEFLIKANLTLLDISQKVSHYLSSSDRSTN